ncbi:unnamed protein product [Amoebophrya sp. A120]|nr:unnamed protein product [Amoebophrya sp. A120]|eukprot:GSA120T00001741001.1
MPSILEENAPPRRLVREQARAHGRFPWPLVVTQVARSFADSAAWQDSFGPFFTRQQGAKQTKSPRQACGGSAAGLASCGVAGPGEAGGQSKRVRFLQGAGQAPRPGRCCGRFWGQYITGGQSRRAQPPAKVSGPGGRRKSSNRRQTARRQFIASDRHQIDNQQQQRGGDRDPCALCNKFSPVAPAGALQLGRAIFPAPRWWHCRPPAPSVVLILCLGWPSCGATVAARAAPLSCTPSWAGRPAPCLVACWLRPQPALCREASLPPPTLGGPRYDRFRAWRPPGVPPPVPAAFLSLRAAFSAGLRAVEQEVTSVQLHTQTTQA